MNDDGTPTRIAIRVDGREPMRGAVESGESKSPQPFTGWLGLLKVLEGSLAPKTEREPEEEHA